MMNERNRKPCSSRLCILAFALAFAVWGGASAGAQDPAEPPKLTVDRNQLQARLAAVETLIESSSAARQIESSGDARAGEKRARARSLHREAREAFTRGDNERALKLAAEASAQMFEAARLANPEQITEKKLRDDYSVRAESARALLAALTRIGSEKPAAGSAEAVRTAEKLLAEAEALAASDVARARAKVEQAYLVARAAIGSMREGDTLVRSLQFASKEEEYRYELDRNDTHQLLLRVLLQEKGERPEARQLVENARRLRGEAEGAASSGDHAAAVRLLEESTQELVRAIRGAGIFIPG